MPSTIASVRSRRRLPSNNTTEPASRSTVTPEARRDLHQRLLLLPFGEFASCIALLLERLGYEDVQPAGRTTGAKQTQSVGYDLAALAPGNNPSSSSPAPLSLPPRRRVIVQLKQYGAGAWVYQRQVDELRGTCLRVSASEALLITTASLSYSIRRQQMQNAPLAPVRLIDGEELLDLLLACGVTVMPRKQEPGEGRGTEQNNGGSVGCSSPTTGGAGAAEPSSRSPKISVTVFITANGGGAGSETNNKRLPR